MQISSKPMGGKMIERVAERFRILGDPLRLRLLQHISEGEMSVAELVEAVESTQANVSKHLQILLRAGVLERRKEGLRVFYRVVDPRVFELCDVVCGSLADHVNREMSVIEEEAKRSGKKATAPRRKRSR